MQNLSRAVVKARTFELILKKSRIAIDQDDIFQDKLSHIWISRINENKSRRRVQEMHRYRIASNEIEVGMHSERL